MQLNLQKVTPQNKFLLKKVNKGKLIIISSPSGAGKTTITKKLVASDKKNKLSVSVTTRKPRLGEINNKDYVFVTKKKFQQFIKNKSFLEYAKVFDNYYGTLKRDIFKNIKKKNIILDIDWQGARQIKKKLPKYTVTIFILPPSIKELKNRLLKREKNYQFIKKRMSKAKKEIMHWKEYDYVVVNNNLNKCLNEIKLIINSLYKKPENFYL